MRAPDLTNPLRALLTQQPLLAAVIYTGVGALPVFLVSAQILQLEREVGFGVGRLGLATAAYFGAAALAANPAGRVVARVGPGRSLRIGGLLTLASCVIAGTATTWWMLPLATAIGGAGNGLIQVASNMAIFDGVARHRQGLGFGAKQASVPAASVLAGISLPLIGLIFGWRWVFALAGLIALTLVFSAPDLDMAKAAQRNERRVGRPPLSLLLLSLGGISGAMAGNGLSLFIVPSAVDIGITEAAAGAVLAVSSILVVAVRLGAGWTVDHNESRGHIEMAWLAGAGAIGALVLLTSSAPLLYLVAMPIAVLGAWGWPGIFFFTVVHSYPEFPARASGLALSGNLTGTVIGPLIIGWLAGRSDYRGAWAFAMVMSAISAMAFVASYLAKSRSEVSL
jgi:MFS family permease